MAAVCAVLALEASPADAQSPEERYKWWQSDRVKTEIGLTADQSQRIEAIFQSTLPRMRSEKDTLDKQEHVLSRLMTEATADEPDIVAAIERVEEARSTASKTRLVMLYRMYRVLLPEQRTKLDAMHERLRQERRDRETGGKHP